MGMAWLSWLLEDDSTSINALKAWEFMSSGICVCTTMSTEITASQNRNRTGQKFKQEKKMQRDALIYWKGVHI